MGQKAIVGSKGVMIGRVGLWGVAGVTESGEVEWLRSCKERGVTSGAEAVEIG